MDRHFDDQGFNDTGLKTRPSELFQNSCWISFEPVEGSLKYLADYIGAHKIMWATDYPHPDGFFPGAPAMVQKKLEGLSAETKHQVMAGGAMAFYGLNGGRRTWRARTMSSMPTVTSSSRSICGSTISEPAYRDRAPRLITNNQGRQQLQVDTALLGSAERGLGAIGAIGARDGHVIADGFSTTRAAPAASIRMPASPTWTWTGSTRRSSIPASACLSAASPIRNSPATCRAYNRWLADYCKPYPDRLFGVAMLPMQDVDLAIAEMRFARKELGFRGGFLGPTRTTTG